MNSDSKFVPLLQDFKIELLESINSPICGLWPDLTLAYTNPAWARFAAENGGEPKISAEWNLGRCIRDAISEPLRPFFDDHFGRCLREGRPWEHTYECSTPDTYREYHMTAFPLGDAEGLLVVHSLRVESAHTRVGMPPVESEYADEYGFILQCSHCRRTKRQGVPETWDWVPSWVTHPPEQTSHGICETCLAYYYSERHLDSGSFPSPFSTANEPTPAALSADDSSDQSSAHPLSVVFRDDAGDADRNACPDDG